LYTCTDVLSSVLENTSASGKLLKVNVIRAANTTTSNRTLSVTIYRSASHEYLIKDVTAVPNASLVIVDKNEYVYLEEGDSIYAVASASSAVDLTLHYEEISSS
jgi:hypothetical protein